MYIIMHINRITIYKILEMIDPVNFSLPHLSTMDNTQLQVYVCDLIKKKIESGDINGTLNGA
jgi:hypothetical protein